MHRRILVASAAFATVAGGLVAAPPASATIPMPGSGCAVSASRSGFQPNGTRGQKQWYVDFRTTCGYKVKAFYHEPRTFGTVWRYGNTRRTAGRSVTDDVLTLKECSAGYEVYYSGGWHRFALRYHRGRC